MANNVYDPKDYLIEVNKGNIEGEETVGIIARNPAVTTSWVDMWGPNVTHVKATAGTILEIVSTSANDTSAGAGARTVLVTYLDDSYVQQSDIVTMNGTTAAQVVSNFFLPISAIVVTAGSLGRNSGTITLTINSGVDAQGMIPVSDVGMSVAQDGHYTVPEGKTGIGIEIVPFFPYNVGGYIRSVLETDGGVKYRGAELPFYQSGVPIPITAPFQLPSKTTIDFQAKLDSGTSLLTMSATILLVDNANMGASQLGKLRVF